MTSVRVICLWLAMTAVAAAANPVRTDFAYGVEVSSSEPAAVYEIPLPLTVYQHTAFSDLRDVRVFNADGEIVPHVIRAQSKPVTVTKSNIQLPIFPLRGNVDEALEGMQITVSSGGENLAVRAQAKEKESLPVVAYLIDARAARQPLTALELTWPSTAPQFSTTVTVETSDDLRYWYSVVSEAPLVNLQFNGQQLSERRIDLPSTEAKFLRLTWGGQKALFELQSLQAQMRSQQVEIVRESTQATAKKIEGNDNEYSFDLQAHLPVREINVDLPQVNTVVEVELLSRAQSKDEWRQVTTATFYRMVSGGSEVRSRALPISASSDRYWLMRVKSNSGIGNGLPVLTAAWEPQRLLFVARGESPFLVAFGSSLMQQAETSFDALLTSESTATESSVVRPVITQSGALMELGGATRLTAKQPADWKRWLLWGVLLLGVGLLIWMARRLLQETATSKS
jgi:hypothetical protein